MQKVFQERVVNRREAEFIKLKKERQEQISQIIRSRKSERETRRKMIYYLKIEEDRIKKLREEEEARQREGKCALMKGYD